MRYRTLERLIGALGVEILPLSIILEHVHPATFNTAES
jgi:hypothetical protein